MTTTSWDGPERREFFRINEEVHLNYQVLTEEEYQAQIQGEDGEESNSAQISQLRELSYQSENLLAGLRKNQPELSQYLSLLEKRLTIFTNLMESSRLGRGLEPNSRINISAGGMALFSREPIAPGNKLALRLIFFPAYLSISALGEVIYSRPQETEDTAHPFRTGIQFTSIDETSQEALARQVLEIQSARLRKEREQQQND